MRELLVLLLLCGFGIFAQNKTDLDTQTKGKNFYWDNTNRRLLIGWNGSFGSALGKKMDIKDAGPISWNHGSLGISSNAYMGVNINLGGYPYDSRHEQDLLNALAVHLNVPPSTSAGHASAISAFARGASATLVPVGIYAQSGITTNTAFAWAANFLAVNCNDGGQYCGPGDGLATSGNIYGLEVDFGSHSDPMGQGPTGGVAGILLIGGADAEAPNLFFDGIGIASGVTMAHSTDTIKLTRGISLGLGCCATAIEVGYSDLTPGSGSMPIKFLSYSGASVVRISTLQADADGNFAVNYGAGQSFVVGDGTGGIMAQIAGAAASGTFTLGAGVNFTMGTNGHITLGTNGIITNPSIKSLSGTRYVCVNTTGQFVSSTTACSGT